MRCEFHSEDSGRLVCTLGDPDGEHIVSAAVEAEARLELAAALADVESTGEGECYWSDSNSDYRWVFKREDGRVRLAILRLTGVVPGYQHVAWVEEDASSLIPSLREALTRV